MGLTDGQKACVNTLDEPLVVAAGAGSGKTFTLTRRIVEALKSGAVADIDEVCAITFTKKAAAELKSRVKSELRACGMAGQAVKVDEAWISTIHGMCARILRAHAIELGIAPGFGIVEGAQVEEYLARAVDAVLAEAQAEGPSDRVDALFGEYRPRSNGGFGASVEGMLLALVEAASARPDGASAFVLPGITAAPQVVVEQALDVVERVMALAEAEKESAKRDEWIAATGALLDSARAALDGGVATYGEAHAAVAPFKLAKNFGGKEFRAQVEEARGALGAFVMEARVGAARPHLETLVGLAGRALDVFTRLKRDDGVLDNNDLLVLAARAIEDHPPIAARYVDKFRLVMVDEFQDTDQMQVDMIKRLAGEGFRRLCTVGDAQQSIYRFRGADVSVYRRHLESVRAHRGGSVIELSDNFRSHGNVLSFVDRVFGGPGMFGGGFMSLAAKRDEGRVAVPFRSPGPRIVVQHTTRPWRGVGSKRVLEAGARRIAREFAGLVEAGHSPGDMVLLLGRMANAGAYAQALRDEGLPCVISGGSVFAQTAEAGVVRELVRVIANPRETQSLFNVLTGPLFALTAGDLLGTGGLEGFWRAAGEGRGADAGRPLQLACALRVMGEARRAAGDRPVARIVEAVVAGSGWLSRLERQGAEGLAAAGNIAKAVRMIDGIERSGPFGPVSVMRRFEESLASSKEAPGALSVSGGNSVRIMTIHASKGLEFPIVAVAEMREDGAPSSCLLTASLDGKVYLSLDLCNSVAGGADGVDLNAVRDYVLGLPGGEDELAGAVKSEAGALHRRLALRDYIATGDGDEAKRLLYVALTRAKEALVVSTAGTRTKANGAGVPKSALAGVFEALESCGAVLGEGRCLVDFGGSAPASLECVGLEPESAPDDAPGDDASGGQAPSAGREPFMVPAPDDAAAPEREAYRPLREGVFSYSSVSDAAHEGDVLPRLAGAYAVSVDGAWESEAAPVAARRDGGRESGALQGGPAGGSLLEDGARPFDEDRATDLGTAFHRLAQYAVVTRGAGTRLARPPQERIDALSRTCNLDAGQRARLSGALDRWFGCDLAREMGALPQLDAEVPFFVAVNGGGRNAYLEGEIDLLGFDEGRAHARVVDYKTGGGAGESADDLRCKHVLQASCYAYAVLLQGARSVDAEFVRVEWGRADDAAQPQCVRYRFTAGDLPALERAIASVYGACLPEGR